MLEDLQNIFQIRTFGDFLAGFLDIAIVAYLIYRGLLLIRGTRAVPILFGLVAIIIGYFVSKDAYLGLSTFNWVLEKFIAAFILLVIVIFQEDIRRGLAKVGRYRFFRAETAAEETHSIEEVVRACVNLSGAKVGALIAIERESDLSMRAEEGIPIDAKITHELLFSLFNPAFANPTHDGAVILRHGRITAAGCFLPLTSNPRVSKQLGTRHRAAIGLSEETDAVICIVSEETASISVAYQSEMTRGLDANSLRDVLQRLLTTNDGEGDEESSEGGRSLANMLKGSPALSTTEETSK
ncbi:MAG: diadenylate cyclase CdaA [Myxococcales bacterium]|nr:diadenylate cyclase CdaA [Myxococcales bacterium]